MKSRGRLHGYGSIDVVGAWAVGVGIGLLAAFLAFGDALRSEIPFQHDGKLDRARRVNEPPFVPSEDGWPPVEGWEDSE